MKIPSLPEMISAGAILTMPDGYRVILADAGFDGHQLWWHEAFGREHFLDCDQAREDYTQHTFYAGETRLATIRPTEGEEDQDVWDKWNVFLLSPEGRDTAENIAAIKRAALNLNGE